jgi:hypothetical protein
LDHNVLCMAGLESILPWLRIPLGRLASYLVLVFMPTHPPLGGGGGAGAYVNITPEQTVPKFGGRVFANHLKRLAGRPGLEPG